MYKIVSLADLYSASLLSGKLPLVWKKAKIIPIPKKTKNTYRPISLLPIQSTMWLVNFPGVYISLDSDYIPE